ncbi:DUF86 domain-containing protein [Domibacillus enclensis]|uniref:Uncharacterized conserved protein YutE, UPF0331/DUF86 family n=1 Tax=Domibacillus enclensis TaxID=1017273 RepID=A0A1N6YCJ2_9BACI|nr:DUF86 domain-containing protein [Domibacillus enclensis]OXS77592.1 hypothetical protein B1B05_12200 [Domibacillus enclensis]SIR12298.1 Uncharacterized conserved protein YutE, UPF0331/DUF86 family [Domibacillus enclensis]
MYFIDRKKMEETLRFMEQQLALFESQPVFGTAIEKLALERIAQTLVESVIDVGNAMIDGFIMRDPGSYEDIIDIMEDENVILPEQSAPLKDVIGLRKGLVREYVTISHDELAAVLTANKKELADFPKRVRAYLENELGPVSAFLPEEGE